MRISLQAEFVIFSCHESHQNSYVSLWKYRVFKVQLLRSCLIADEWIVLIRSSIVNDSSSFQYQNRKYIFSVLYKRFNRYFSDRHLWFWDPGDLKGMPYIMPKTSSKEFRQKIRDIKVWLYPNRDQPLKKLMGMLNLKLIGHYRYYGISFNGRMISNYKQQVRELLFKVLNRRSDRKSYTREGFIEMLKYYPLAMPKIYVSLFWDCKYYYEEPYAGKPHVRFCEGLTLWGVSLLDLWRHINGNDLRKVYGTSHR